MLSNENKGERPLKSADNSQKSILQKIPVKFDSIERRLRKSLDTLEKGITMTGSEEFELISLSCIRVTLKSDIYPGASDSQYDCTINTIRMMITPTTRTIGSNNKREIIMAFPR